MTITEKTYHNYSWGKHINDRMAAYCGGWKRIRKEIEDIKNDSITVSTMERINEKAGYAYIVVSTNCELGTYSVLFALE